MYCSITVKGHLHERWTDWFDGLAVTNLENGEAILAGLMTDQAALHGVLSKVRDLALPLTAVHCGDGCSSCKDHASTSDVAPGSGRGGAGNRQLSTPVPET